MQKRKETEVIKVNDVLKLRVVKKATYFEGIMSNDIPVDLVASYVIDYYWDRHRAGIGNLELGVVLYFIEVWYLEDKRELLYRERFHAWGGCGIVMPSLYHKYKCYGKDRIKRRRHEVLFPKWLQGHIDYVLSRFIKKSGYNVYCEGKEAEPYKESIKREKSEVITIGDMVRAYLSK